MQRESIFAAYPYTIMTEYYFDFNIQYFHDKLLIFKLPRFLKPTRSEINFIYNRSAFIANISLTSKTRFQQSAA